MKSRLAVLLTALACLLAARVSSPAAVEVSFSAGIEINSPNEFYEPLTPYGEWVSVGSYGRCWRPIDVEPGWRPYCEGHWEWTDCGWYWVSDEPWSWACYHYGSWVDDPSYGWCWLPGTEWAPAWVTWREAPDYVGWAPCGPGGAVLAPSLFVFVDVHRFHDRIRPNTVIVNNTTIINRTRVINNIRREDREFDGSRRRVVVNEGPRTEVIARATGRSFTPKPIREVVRETPVPERIRRSGTIDRPVLREQNVQDRQRIEQRRRERTTTDERQRDRQVSPTGRDQPRNLQQPEQQRPEQVRPDQRPTPSTPDRRDRVQPEQPGRATPERPIPPTGGDQPRTFPQPEQRPSVPQRPEQTRPEQRPTPSAPDRREQVRPERPATVTPDRPVPPTGREQPRVFPGQQQPSRPGTEPVRPQERPTPPSAPGRHEQVQPQERPTPSAPERQPQVRPERPAPPVPPERVLPPTGREVPKEPPSVKEVPQAHERPANPPDKGRGQDRKDKDKGPDGQ